MATEKRLIDANAFEANIQKMFKPYGDGTYPGDYEAMIHDETLVDVLQTIEEAPTVDAVEVVHGRWEWYTDRCEDLFLGCDEDYGWRCSRCKVPLDDEDDPEVMPTFRYCHNCGAKMDGDGNG